MPMTSSFAPPTIQRFGHHTQIAASERLGARFPPEVSNPEHSGTQLSSPGKYDAEF